MSETKFHMRRKDREVTDLEKIRKIIKKATICRLGLVEGGEAYIVPVNFGYENNCLYFHSALHGRKIELIRKNRKISFEIEGDYSVERGKSGCDVKYQSIIGRGSADVIDDNEEKIRGLKSIMRQCTGSKYEFSRDRLDTVLLVRIEIENMTCKQAGF